MFRTRKAVLLSRATALEVTRLRPIGTGLSESSHGSLATDEMRCGMVTSVALQNGKPRHVAVVKSSKFDWHVNELDRFGEVVTLHSRPRGLWKKLAPPESILIEDSSDESFSLPEKTFTPRSLNHGQYAPVQNAPPSKTPVLQFNMYREAQSIDSVLNRMQYEIGATSAQVNFAGQGNLQAAPTFGESFGCVTNQGAVLNVSMETLPRASRHRGLNALIFDPHAYVPLHTGDLGLRYGFHVDTQGTSYNVLLRCSSMKSNICAAEMMRDIQRSGFLNYFPLTYFSGRSTKSHEVAGMVGRGEFAKASSVYLQSHAESSPVFKAVYQKYVNSSHTDSRFAADLMKNTAVKLRMSSPFVRFLSALASGDVGEQELWERCPDSHRSNYFHGAVAFLFNAMASQRVLSGGVASVVPGDLVYVTGEEFRHQPQKFHGFVPALVEGIFAPSDEIVYVGVVDEAKVGDFDAFRVVLPLCDHRNEGILFPTSIATKAFHLEFAKAHSLEWLLSPVTEGSFSSSLLRGSRFGLVGADLSHLHTYRTVLSKPRDDWSVHVEDDPNSFALLKSDLFLMQERKSQRQIQHATVVPRGGEVSRFRRPSPFNMSPSQRDDLSEIVANHSYGGNRGQTSVALSFRLPRGAHAMSMLRDRMELVYATVDDLIRV